MSQMIYRGYRHQHRGSGMHPAAGPIQRLRYRGASYLAQGGSRPTDGNIARTMRYRGLRHQAG